MPTEAEKQQKLLVAAKIAFREIDRHDFGGPDQNPHGIRDLLYSAIIAIDPTWTPGYRGQS